VFFRTNENFLLFGMLI